MNSHTVSHDKSFRSDFAVTKNATSTFIIRAGNKDITFIRTCTGRFFDISNRRICTNGHHIDDNDGLIPEAVEVSASYVAELVARFGVKPRVKGKASKIHRFQKEVKA